jgi:hypothetical protein
MADDYNPDDIYAAMRKADAAGDGEAVKALAAHLQTLQAAPTQPDEAAFRAKMHDMLAAPTIDRAAVHKFIRDSGYTDTDPTVDQGIDYAIANPGHLPGLNVDQHGVPPEDKGSILTAAESAGNWFSAGVLDPAAAALDAVIPGVGKIDDPGVKSIWDGASFGDAYKNNVGIFRKQEDVDAAAHPVANVTGAVVGGLLSPVNKIAAPVRGAGLVANLVRAGAAAGTYGVVHGAATSRAPTLGGVATDAAREGAISGVGGVAVGGVLAGASSVGSKLVSAGRRVMAGVPAPGAGANLIASRMANDGLTPSQALSVIRSARSTGTPMVLADLGDNLRSLAGSVSRTPGPARTIAMDATLERQMGQTGRIRDAINDTVGPTTDTFAEHQRLIEEARAKAGPLYEQAYASPPVSSPTLDRLLATPAGKAALGRAHTIAANEMRDPKSLGFVVGEDGHIVLDPVATVDTGDMSVGQDPLKQRGYTPQSLDYVKRGLDDIIQAAPRDARGKPIMDEGLRAVQGVLKRFTAETDKLNPSYAAARRAYAGPAAAASAMNEGRLALNKSANEIGQRLNNMTETERQQYALGLRSAIADTIDRAPDGANVARRVIGSTAKREVLARVFGSTGEVDNLVTRLENEAATHRTYAAVHGGSPTANRLAEDGATSADLGLLQQGFDLVNAAKNGKTGVIGHLLSKGRDALTYGQGKVGQRTREDASALLFNSDPLALTDALNLSTSERLLAAAHRSVIARRGLIAGGRTGAVVGAAVGNRR